MALFFVGTVLAALSSGIVMLIVGRSCMRRGLPPSPRWLVTQDRGDEAEAVVAKAEETAREVMDHELPEPEPFPDEAPAERFPIRLRPPMVGRLALFVGIWFVYYIGNYGWLTLAPTLFVRQGLQPRGQHHVSDRLGHRLPGRSLRHHFITSMTIGLLVPMLYTYTAEHFSTNARADRRGPHRRARALRRRPRPVNRLRRQHNSSRVCVDVAKGVISPFGSGRIEGRLIHAKQPHVRDSI